MNSNSQQFLILDSSFMSDQEFQVIGEINQEIQTDTTQIIQINNQEHLQDDKKQNQNTQIRLSQNLTVSEFNDNNEFENQQSYEIKQAQSENEKACKLEDLKQEISQNMEIISEQPQNLNYDLQNSIKSEEYIENIQFEQKKKIKSLENSIVIQKNDNYTIKQLIINQNYLKVIFIAWSLNLLIYV